MIPRPAILLPLAYGAGLVTGLAHFQAPLCAAVMMLVIVLWSRRVAALAAGAALLGLGAGSIARVRDAGSCAARLPVGVVTLDAMLTEPVGGTGGILDVRPSGVACSGVVRARWPAALPMDAGVEVRLAGRWIADTAVFERPTGILLVSGARITRAAPSASMRLRTAIATASRTLYGTRSGMVETLVVGRRGGIDRDEQRRFAAAGLVHLLSISGFHVGLLVGWTVLLLRGVGVRRVPALVAGAVVVTLYVAFLGFPAPATRALALAWAAALERLRQRHVHANALLATTCLVVLLVDPWAVVDLGAWLSAGSLWGAGTLARWSDRALGRRAGWRMLASSIGATVATAPITAAALGSVALVGVVLNFVAIPAAAVAVPAVVLSLLAFPLWRGAAEILAAGGGLGLHLLERLADLGSAVSWGHVETEPGLAAALPWVALLAAVLWIVARRTTRTEAGRRAAWVATAAAWVTLLVPLGAASSDDGPGLTLHFLDVGQGDAALLRTPGGRWLAVDAGPRGPRGDAGERVVAPYLAQHGARQLDALVLSHAHTDHVGGAPALLRRLPIGMVIEPGQPVDDAVYYDLLGAIEATHTPWHRGRPGDRFEVDGVRCTFLHPDPTWPHWGEDLNEDSLVLLVEYGAFRALFAGDAGFPVESLLHGRIGRIDLLKVGHHGSHGATSDGWLTELAPSAAVISVAGHNDYGHPAPETLARLAQHRIPVWRTDEQGTVTVTTDGRTMHISGRRGRADVVLRGAVALP